MAEKEHLSHEEKHADRLYHLKACELDQRAVDLATADEETRRNITRATKEYNLALVCFLLENLYVMLSCLGTATYTYTYCVS